MAEMKHQHADPGLDLLGQVREADPPPFLLARIRQRIAVQAADWLPSSWAWALGGAAGLLLLLNLLAFYSYSQKTRPPAASFASELLPQNDLY
jgi:hypothetical protein